MDEVNNDLLSIDKWSFKAQNSESNSLSYNLIICTGNFQFSLYRRKPTVVNYHNKLSRPHSPYS